MPKKFSLYKERSEFCLTIWDPDELIKIQEHKHCKYMIYQIEKAPDTGTLHAQTYLEWKKSICILELKNVCGLKTSHIEPRFGPRKDAREYCMKVESRNSEDEWGEIGEWVENIQGQRQDILNLVEDLKEGISDLEIVLNHAHLMARYTNGVNTMKQIIEETKAIQIINREIIWIWGKSDTGKSHRVTEQYPHVCMIEYDGKFFNGYREHEVVCFDDIVKDHIEPRVFLRITDKYPVPINIKGTNRPWKAKKIFFTSNYPPDAIFEDVDGTETFKAIMRRITKIIHVKNKTDIIEL